MLKNKKVIVLGDKDGIPGSVIEICVKTAGAEVIFNSTICYACSITGTIDDETRQKIKQMIEKYESENVIVILGCASALIARTLISDDPQGICHLSIGKTGLCVYHMLEPEIKNECDSDVYKDKCKVMEIVLESNEIIEELKLLRKNYLNF